MTQALLHLTAIAAGFLCLTGCGTNSVDRGRVEALVTDKKPVVSAAVLSEPQGPTEIPRGAPLITQWELWAEDRDRLDACVMLSAAKTTTIKALQEK